MTKNTLCILLGAAAASGWWAFGLFDQPAALPAALASSITALIVIINDTVKLIQDNLP